MERQTMYHRILEGIDDGIAQALSRRKGQEITINPGREISRQEDTETYEKHTKDWFEAMEVADAMDAGTSFIDSPDIVRRLNVLLGRDRLAPDAEQVMRERILPTVTAMADSISSKLAEDAYVPLDADEHEFFWKVMDKVDSRNHRLYGTYKACDTDDRYAKTVIRDIVSNMAQEFSQWVSLNWIDVSGVRDMSGLFCDYEIAEEMSPEDRMQYMDDEGNVPDYILTDDESSINYFDGDISLWDVSNVEDMSRMFMGCDFDKDISGWDVSGVTSMESMFRYSKFTKDISGWETDPDCDTTNMFADTNMPGHHKPHGCS